MELLKYEKSLVNNNAYWIRVRIDNEIFTGYIMLEEVKNDNNKRS